MKSKKALTVSIVIPVYNEEDHIGACLDSIAAQTTMPDEVIVVDNNCTDKTTHIAQQYSFVKIVKETKQGRTAARNRGFNTARGDIIGRIDADSILMKTWVERVKQDFKDPELDGLTGLGQTRVLPLLFKWYSTFWARVYFWSAHSFFRAKTMWGANMAIRNSAWQNIKNDVAKDGSHVHEDQDVSLVLLSHGGKIRQDNRLLITTEGSSYLYLPKFLAYLIKTFRMRAYHKSLGTYDRLGSNKLNIVTCLPGLIVFVVMTSVFIVYAFIMWPFISLILRFSKKPTIRIR